MSDVTKAAFDEALDAHLRDECGGVIVTGYALHVSYLNVEMDSDHSTGYFVEYPLNQSAHSTWGLVMMHLQFLKNGFGQDDD